MTNKLSEYYRHKEDTDLVIRVLKDDAGTITVCGDDDQSTIFHLTREELEFNFEPMTNEPGPDDDGTNPTEAKT